MHVYFESRIIDGVMLKYQKINILALVVVSLRRKTSPYQCLMVKVKISSSPSLEEAEPCRENGVVTRNLQIGH